MAKRKKPRYQIEAERPHRIPANLAAQAKNNSYHPPTFYEDKRFECIDCGNEEVWTAEQQKWWHEVAKGPIFSTAVWCRSCRKKLRENHQGTPRRSHGERRRDDEQST